MIYSDNTYDITNNIATYTRRVFKSVFDTTSSKWYMLNNLDEYEEYGIYGDSFDTYYTGKLVIVNDHEYEWNGTEWDDLGEYVEKAVGWTNDTVSNFSIKYNGSNYILKATQNDVEITIFCLQNVPSSKTINFLLATNQNDIYEYQLFYTGGRIYFDLGFSNSRRVDTSYSWFANTEYVIRGTNGNYLDTTSNMKLFINDVFLGSKSRSTYDNTSDKILMNYISQYIYNKEFKIYESTGLLFDIKCKEDNGQYVLYDALGNGELYNYGTEDPVVVTPILTSQRPKDYVAKTAPTISTIWASTIYRNSAHLTTFMRNDVEQAIWSYMEDDILKKGEALPPIDYLCFEAIEAGTVKFEAPNGFSQYLGEPNLEYSFNKTTWTTLHINNTVSLQANDKIYFRGQNPNGFTYGRGSDGSAQTMYLNCLFFTNSYNISGNIMTLIDKNGTTTTIPNAYCFGNLFCTELTTQGANNGKIIDASNLKLPATTLTLNCYRNLFNGNKLMVYPPKILPAMTMVYQCYANMFLRCSALLESPILPATNLLNECYKDMFNACTSLKKITCYATSGMGNTGLKGTNNWCYAISNSNGDFYKANGSNWPTGASGIPSGWTIHTSL